MIEVSNIFDSSYLDRIVSVLDNETFQTAFGSKGTASDESLIELKLGAMLDYEDWITDLKYENNFVQSAAADSGIDDKVLRVFEQWQAYISAALKSREIELRDIMLATVAGLWSRRPTELRHVLCSKEIRKVLDREPADVSNWPRRVRDVISKALILVARQDDRSDIENAMSYIDQLKSLQKNKELSWLDEAQKPDQSALNLLALYHAAQATVVVTQYVLTGVYSDSRGRGIDVSIELRTLLSKAREYADVTSDPELSTWIKSVSLIISKLRSDSIWASGYNINEKIDQLVQSVSSRKDAIFSMLPSQQDALARNLLDAQREAVILQMPTSSGKTLMAQLAALQTISSYANSKVIYLTPTRALATQIRRTLGSDFADLGVDVTSAGSAFEEDPFEMAILRSVAGIIVSTPEKLDLLLRGHGDWFKSVRLVIVDEAHLLKDGERGARLELLLANIRREHPHVRLLLLTPFVENAHELANWLSKDRGQDVGVEWRPSRLIIGLSRLVGRGKTRSFEIEWKEPHRQSALSNTLMRLTDGEREAIKKAPSVRTKAIVLSKRLRVLGPSLAMFPASRVDAEKAALEMANTKEEVDSIAAPPEFRVAIALAASEYGETSDLVSCLKKGVAFHHSALSNELRFLVERLASLGVLDFIAATTTLAQGMNFPVSSVVIHSVSKPWVGPLTPAEFWNIAGRAGRVGLSEKGVIVFASSEHKDHWENYTNYLSERIDSALAGAVQSINETDTVKWTYRNNEAIRPFIQYLGHAVATLGVRETTSDLERLVTASLAGRSAQARISLVKFARRYLGEVSGKAQSYMKVADQTGLASFSFDELYANIMEDPVLRDGKVSTLREPEGLKHLIDALAKLPELSLALEKGLGSIDTKAVADVVHKWMNGASIQEIASSFPGENEADRIREAGRYVFKNVSQTVSWGAHAYLRGHGLQDNSGGKAGDEQQMLPAYIQYGVNNPAAVLASIMGVPRQVAVGLANVYKERHGDLQTKDGGNFREFLKGSDLEVWRDAVAHTKLAQNVSAGDLRSVWRDAQGLDREKAYSAAN